MRIARVLLSLVLLIVPYGHAQPRGTIGCTWTSSTFESQLPRLSNTTGNATLDSQLNREYQMLSAFFGVKPTFYIYDDSGAPNAIAFPPQSQPGYSGAVIFGINLMRNELTDQPQNISIPAIMAHEFGHIVQYNAGCDLPVRSKEIQADYLAGSYLKHRFQGTLTQEIVNQASMAFYTKGDYLFNEEQHHGTPQLRLAMVQAGLFNLDTTLADHCARSYRMARLYDPSISSDEREAELERLRVEAGLPPQESSEPVEQPVRPTRPPAPNGSGPSLQATMNFIQTQVGSIGQVNYTTFVHDDNSGADSTVSWSVERTNVRASAANCRFDSHRIETRNGVETTKEPSLPFRGVQRVEVLPMEQVLEELISDKPELTGFRVEPSLFVIRLTGPNLKHELVLDDESQANNIAKALTRAAALCGANKEPF